MVAISQFDRDMQLLRISLSTGERDIIPSHLVDEDHIAFGLFDFEGGDKDLDSVALIATPRGPLLFLKDIQYRPDINLTKIQIEKDGGFFHFKISHDKNYIFGLFYKEKSGIGLHPYNHDREDIDFYYWLCKNINTPLFYQAYTKDIIYL